MRDIENFLDKEGKIKNWPSKQQKKLEVLLYLSSKFETNRQYSEKEVNTTIQSWHTFEDYFLLRRGLIEKKLLVRTKDGAMYWRDEINDDR